MRMRESERRQERVKGARERPTFFFSLAHVKAKVNEIVDMKSKYCIMSYFVSI